MGEVRARVKLSNPYDELRARHGEIPTAQVRTYEADAMVDSGAVRTIIPIAVFDRLGLETQRTTVAEYADGRTDAVRLTDGLRIEILGRDTFDEALDRRSWKNWICGSTATAAG